MKRSIATPDETLANASAPEALHGLVWVLDDSPLELQASANVLSAEHDVETFSTGGALLERFAAGARPTVLVLDWHLPDINGVEVCRVVRATCDAISLPVLMLTGQRGGTDDLVEALGAGANDHVTKPFVPAELRARVQTLVRVQRLHETAREAEQLLRDEAMFRERFIGILGHDLRTPLASILLSASVMHRRADLPEAARESVGRITRSTRRMEAMIADLLDLTRTRAGAKLPLSPREADARAICQGVLDEVRGAHPNRAVVFDADGETRGTWDPNRLEQVVSNLVVNAIQYSPAGSQVDVRVKGSAKGVTLSVTNQGPPIAAQAMSTLFDPFRRGQTGHDPMRRSQGLGLGLYIVRQIVEAHGGSTEVQSNEREGTRFTVHLPREVPPAASRTP